MLVDDLDLIDANLCIYMFYYKSKDGIRAIVPSEFQKIIEDNLEKRNFIEKCRKM